MQRFDLKQSIAMASLLALALAACGDDDDVKTDGGPDAHTDARVDATTDGGVESASIRFAHLVFGAPAVRACVYTTDGVAGPFPSTDDDEEGVEFEEVTPYFANALNAGTDYTIGLIVEPDSGEASCPTDSEDDLVVLRTTVDGDDVAADGFHTIAAVGREDESEGPEPTLQLYTDTSTAGIENFEVRAINGLIDSTGEGAGGPDIKLCFDGFLSDTDLIVDDLSYGEASSYVEAGGPLTEPGVLYARPASEEGCNGAEDSLAAVDIGVDDLLSERVIDAFVIGDTASSDAVTPRKIVLVHR